jgi:5-methylthioadenosine/S-adenosylhomocysteine deaminase
MSEPEYGTEIFEERRSLLLTGVWHAGGEVDLYIDEQGLIADLGEGIRHEYTGEAEYLLDGTDRLLLPGLVNTHTHAAMTLLRGYADDMHLQEWLAEKIWPLEAHLTGTDVYWGTKLACIEMIRTGTVAFNDMYFFMQDAARAVEETGMKAQLAYGFIDLFDDEKREQEIKATKAAVEAIKAMDNSRIRAAVGPHAIYTVSPEGLEWLADYSKGEDIGIHLHLSETEQEVNDCIDKTGMRPAPLLDRCGCLTPRTVAAHCCWLDEAECRLLGERGTYVSHNPSSNMKLAVNRAMPYRQLRDATVPVTLGTDGCASNNNLDLIEEMKFAALLQKFYWNSDTLLPADDALAMATTAGARALGTGSGRIEVGERADIILLNRSALCMTPMHNPVSNVVYACSGAAVTTVICDGRVLMAEGVIPDEEEIRRGAAMAAENLVERAQDG